MSTVKSLPKTASYEVDFNEWATQQADALRHHRASALDWTNLAEEVASLGRSDQREVVSRLTTLFVHLLKWRYQSSHRTDGWAETIGRERIELPLIFDQSPSLVPFARSAIGKAYRLARSEAARQTKLTRDTFPTEPTFSLDEALDPDFWPEA